MKIKPDVLAVCATALVIALLWFWQGRYEFINEQGPLVSVGDRWTGCVDYLRPTTKTITRKMTLSEIREKYPQYNDLSDRELSEALEKKFDPTTAAPVTGKEVDAFLDGKISEPITYPASTEEIRYVKIIRSEC